jgi:glycosyltransferase involved in cell wall biosynthesis
MNRLSSPSVAVVIPFFNGSSWIERALKSAVNQSQAPNEILVVDDGSTSDERIKLEELKFQYDFEIYSQENSGQSAARNLGVSKSGSDYICLLDQDDYFLPNHIESLVQAADLSDPNFGFAYGDLLRVDEAGEILNSSSLPSPHPLEGSMSMISQNMHILPSATLIKKSSFLSVGGFDELLRGYEDDDLFLRFHLAGHKIIFTPQLVSAWTLNRSSTSFSESMARSRYIYFKKLLDISSSEESLGKNVFEDGLFSRFGFVFAYDVVNSVVNDGKDFQERLERLHYFVAKVRGSKRLNYWARKKYLLATWPLMNLNPKLLGMILSTIVKLAPMLGPLKSHLLNDFLSRHSSVKKTV